MPVPCVLLSCLLALGFPGPRDEPRAVDVLEASRAAFLELGSVQYGFELVTSGAAKSTTAGMEGLARLLAADGDGGPYHFMAGTLIPTDAAQQPLEFTVARVGDIYQVSNRAERVLFLAKGRSVGSRMISFTDPVLLENFISKKPFEVAGDGADISLDGTAEVAGELCDVLVIPGRRGLLARWFIARSDHLPRVVEREVKTPQGAGLIRLELSGLKLDPELEPRDFKLRAPPGWRTVDVNAANAAPFAQPAPRRMPDGLLMRGEAAPAFELESPDGETVSLEDLRGQVVVLDFWATWCPPCRRAMPGIQELHDDYAGKGVAVYGVSTSERGGDPAALMADKGFTYGLLLDGERIAPFYGVSALPTCYVIDKAGRVVLTTRGFTPRDEAFVRKAIDDALTR